MKIDNVVKEVEILVVDGGGPPLMGRDLLKLLKNYSELFKDNIGLLRYEKIKLSIPDNTKPKFFKPRTIPFAFKAKVEAELQRLEEADIPVSAEHIKREIQDDPVLFKVYEFIRNGWPNYLGEEQLLQELHAAHAGVVKMKSKARSYFWWPLIDKEIEELAKSCDACNKVRPNPPKAAVIPYNEAKHIFDRIHIDFFGPFRDKMFLKAFNDVNNADVSLNCILARYLLDYRSSVHCTTNKTPAEEKIVIIILFVKEES
ncbi:Integrase zinc binding domain [Popillia japonica]|uniref:RNA-directed DNA polymerase n=1 Tax=Popillia japonica TaxID=7064 RepID=A0AAW1JJ67_POPJA